jgi:hypothetical protein
LICPRDKLVFEQTQERLVMNKEVFDREMKIAEIQGEIREKNGMNWVMISFAVIILTIIITAFAVKLMPTNIFQNLEDNSNASGSPTH